MTTHGQYTYIRGTDGCDNTFDIYDPSGELLTSIHYWEREEGAEADARLIVSRLNLHDRLLDTLRFVLTDLNSTIDYEARQIVQTAIAEAEGAVP